MNKATAVVDFSSPIQGLAQVASAERSRIRVENRGLGYRFSGLVSAEVRVQR
jgi:hypothetical protein